MQMVEFSEDLSQRYEGKSAMLQRALYRLSVRLGEIPYFNGGLDVEEFTSRNISGAVRRVLADFDVDIFVSGDRVVVGDIMLNLPGGLF